jgi:hypothetical protein
MSLLVPPLIDRFVTADVAFRAVGVARNVRPLQHHQQFRLVGEQAFQQAVEHDEAGPDARVAGDITGEAPVAVPITATVSA